MFRFLHESNAVLFNQTDVWTNDRVLITAPSQTRRVLLCYLYPGKRVKQKTKTRKPCDNNIVIQRAMRFAINYI